MAFDPLTYALADKHSARVDGEAKMTA